MKRRLLATAVIVVLCHLPLQHSAARMSSRLLLPAPPSPPLGLTAADGTGLLLRRLDAKVVVRGPLAFTELTLAFYNPQPRQREGRFSIALPDGALVTRFAMKLPSGWMEAEVVKRRAAQHIYEDYLHRRQDPALLERSAGNSFSARVFPIFARSLELLKISYSQRLDSTKPYRLRLRGLPRVGRLNVVGVVHQAGGKRVRKVLSRRRVKPGADFTLPASTLAGVRSGKLAVARLRPPLDARAAKLGSSLLVLFDSSASRTLGYDAQLRATLALLSALARSATPGENTALEIAAFDQQVRSIYRGSLRDVGKADSAATKRIRHALAQRRALGASSLEAAIAYVARRRPGRVLLVSDGVVTAGVSNSAALRSRLARFKATTRRLDALAIGGIRDAALLRGLVVGALPEAGVVIDAERTSASAAALALRRQVATDLRIRVPGARFVWPTRVAALAAGEQIVVHAELAARSKALRVIVERGGASATRQTLVVALARAPRPLVAHALVRARVSALETAPASETPEAAAKRREALTKLSLQQRVLCRHTALLVLESEAEYRRYGLSRQRVPPLLAIGRRGVVRERRVTRHVAKARAKSRRRRERRAHRARRARRARQGARRGRRNAQRSSGKARARRPSRRPVIVAKGKARPRASGPDCDHDGIPDAQDKCPNEPEVFNGYQDNDGCPDRGRVVVHMARIMILDKVYFPSGGEVIRPVSRPIIDAVAATLIANPDIQLIEIQGHTDSRGSAYANMLVSRRRARAVRDYLVRKGVLRGRLRARGYGETRPIDAGHTAEAHSKNRRVEFIILKRRGARPARPLTAAQRRRAARAAAAARRQRALEAKLARIERARHQRFRGLWRGGANSTPAQQLSDALSWRGSKPSSTLALLALGRAAQRVGRRALAARAFGSLIDLYSGRADIRRFAGALLTQLADSDNEHHARRLRALGIDSMRRAVKQRPDHQSAHHQLAWALVRAGRLNAALAAAERGLRQRYRRARAKTLRVLREDVALVASVMAARDPKRRPELLARAVAAGTTLSARPSLRFALTWETDANDVDLHVRDAVGGHAYYRHKRLPSGGELIADVTNGYGPEAFALFGPLPKRALPYKLSVHYYRRGPMGYGMGSVRIISYDGRRTLRIEERAFVALRDRETIELGAFVPRGGSR